MSTAELLFTLVLLGLLVALHLIARPSRRRRRSEPAVAGSDPSRRLLILAALGAAAVALGALAAPRLLDDDDSAAPTPTETEPTTTATTTTETTTTTTEPTTTATTTTETTTTTTEPTTTEPTTTATTTPTTTTEPTTTEPTTTAPTTTTTTRPTPPPPPPSRPPPLPQGSALVARVVVSTDDGQPVAVYEGEFSGRATVRRRGVGQYEISLMGIPVALERQATLRATGRGGGAATVGRDPGNAADFVVIRTERGALADGPFTLRAYVPRRDLQAALEARESPLPDTR